MRKWLWIGGALVLAGGLTVVVQARGAITVASKAADGGEVAVVASTNAPAADRARALAAIVGAGGEGGSRTDAELHTLLTAVAANEGRERLQAFQALVDALRARPELLAALEQELMALPAESDDLGFGLNALTVLGTPAAQGTMLHLLTGRRGDEAFLGKLVPAMSFVEKPSPQLEEGLRGLAEGETGRPQRMAALGLGTMAGSLAASDPERAAKILAEYTTKLSAAKAPEATQEYLTVLGNSGLPGVTEVVTPYLDDARAPMRAQALEALRLVQTPEAEDRLVRAVEHDADASTRGSAAWALSYHAPSASLLAAQAAALAVETNEAVARALLDNIWSARSTQHDEVVEVLTRVAQAHPLASIQEEARRRLAGA